MAPIDLCMTGWQSKPGKDNRKPAISKALSMRGNAFPPNGKPDLQTRMPFPPTSKLTPHSDNPIPYNDNRNTLIQTNNPSKCHRP